MPSSPNPDAPWWQRRSPSLLVFVGLLAVLTVSTVALAGQVAEVLPEVPKDRLGVDRWTDPIGVEQNSGLQIGRLPDCASGSVTRIALWDENSEPYWEVAGPPTPMTAFYVGVLPGGFTEVEPYREPPANALVRLVVFRRVGGPAGIRYQAADLRTGFVMAGRPLTSYTVEGFQAEPVCGGAPTDDEDEDGDDGSTVTDLTGTTTPGDPTATSDPATAPG